MSVCVSVCVCVCLHVCVCVCVSVCVHDNSKNNGSIHMKHVHIIVYENSNIYIQDLLISSCLNDLTNC